MSSNRVIVIVGASSGIDAGHLSNDDQIQSNKLDLILAARRVCYSVIYLC
jgi:short-subunit dehydrogenase